MKTLNLNGESKQSAPRDGPEVGCDEVGGVGVGGVGGVGDVGVGGIGVGADGEEVLNTVVHGCGLFELYEFSMPPIALAV